MKVRGDSSPEDLLDRQSNGKAGLLMLITIVLCCSPVCEKQALFAICQSVKENGLEPHLVKKASIKFHFLFRSEIKFRLKLEQYKMLLSVLKCCKILLNVVKT